LYQQQGNRGRRPALEGVNELDESKNQQLALANPQFGTSFCLSDNAEWKRMFQIADWRVLIADPRSTNPNDKQHEKYVLS
jgi:hypothetical protein